MMQNARKWATAHIRGISYAAGSMFVAIWTIIRHLTNGVNFDVVGQIGVADQWANGIHDGAQLGATNYLLKMPVYYLVNQIDFLSPHLKLLVLALAFNIATFVLLLFLFERLLRMYDIRPGTWFYLAVIWLGSISCRVYWLDYANSRNLETVGGILVLYLSLLLFRKYTPLRMAALVGIGGIVFFADQLQIYVIGGGLLLYAVFMWVKSRTKASAIQSATIIGGLAGAFVLAKLLLVAATTLLPVTFLTAPRGDQALSAHNLIGTLQGLGTSTLRVFDASFYAANSAPNTVRELVNLMILLAMFGVLVYAWRKDRARSLVIVCGCCILAAYGAYIASGQALQPITERYLIMVPILLVLAFGSMAAISLRRGIALCLSAAWIGALAISAILSIGALAVNWAGHYSKDAYIVNTLDFLRQNNFTLAVSSRDGITTTYFSEHTVVILPTICLPDHTLVLSNLFYDRAPFATLPHHRGNIPLIVPDKGINSSGSICTLHDIENQFGAPMERLPVPGIGTAVVYDPTQLQLHE